MPTCHTPRATVGLQYYYVYVPVRDVRRAYIHVVLRVLYALAHYVLLAHARAKCAHSNYTYVFPLSSELEEAHMCFFVFKSYIYMLHIARFALSCTITICIDGKRCYQ